MIPACPDFSHARVLVVGDVMLDRYWGGPAERISPEAPVPIIRVEDLTERCGGAANVAFNLARLGAPVSLIGASGKDAEGDRLAALLDDAGVRCRFARDDETPTTLKLRVLSQHHQLMRLDFERATSHAQVEAISTLFDEEIENHDVVVFSDYGKGSLPMIAELIDRCRARGRWALVNPWGKSFDRYRNASLITPNATEFAGAAGTWESEGELEQLARSMAERLSLDAILVTRGERGMSLFRRDEAAVHVASEAREVFDVTGAGDTVIAVLAAGIGAGQNIEAAARLANRAAGIVVGRLGTAAVTPADLTDSRVVGQAELIERVAQARARGERVVMTNGCFDILHAGHVAYLAQAAALGDRLIVAVNSDASVARLKGEGRPINPLEQRAAVLAALRCVDWVTWFDGSNATNGFEDTPRDLIAAVRPDVLVKGGYYSADDVAGGEIVRANGGEVRIIDLVDDVSTTAIVGRIKEPAE